MVPVAQPTQLVPAPLPVVYFPGAHLAADTVHAVLSAAPASESGVVAEQEVHVALPVPPEYLTAPQVMQVSAVCFVAALNLPPAQPLHDVA